MVTSKKIKINSDYHNQRFDIAAAQLFSEISRKKIKSIIDNGGAYINKKRVAMARLPVYEGDIIELFWEERPKNLPLPSEGKGKVIAVNPQMGSFVSKENIIFENEDFLVINKPAGVAAQATLTSTKDTILHAIHLLDPQKYKLENLLLVHRLDKETSGIMLAAKNKDAQKIFEDLFRSKAVSKKYSALCYGIPTNLKGDINYPVAKDSQRVNTYYAVVDKNKSPKDAKSATTHYECAETFPNPDASLIHCYPKTGRTHQIRVHLSAIGCPIIGDKTYAKNIYGHSMMQIALRQMLHAGYIEFTFKTKLYKFEVPFLTDFDHILKTLRSA